MQFATYVLHTYKIDTTSKHVITFTKNSLL